jgi:hypothetical protein
MAASLAWGLGFATILTLFVIPALYSIVDDVRKRFGRLRVSGDDAPRMDLSFTDETCRLDELGRAPDVS